jgi:hypothetical protein
MYGNYLYPEFEKSKQSLLFLNINESQLPFDLIQFNNNETGEIKFIYFDVSSFYGKGL